MLPHLCTLLLLLIVINDDVFIMGQQEEEVKDIVVAECGTTRGCWFVPPGCQDNNNNCTGMVSWRVDDQGIVWTLRAFLDDLRNLARTDTTYYGALGFSLDEFMGNDTVISCTVDNTGYGGVFVGWNDHTSNYLQLQATEVLLVSTTSSQVDSHLFCQGRWNFSGHAKVQAPNYLHDLSQPNATFHLLFARGYADPRTHQLYAHSAADGPKFPWISAQPVTFCSSPQCSSSSPSMLPWLNQSHQSVPSRTAKLGMATIHGILMSLCIFLLIPLGIFSARFGKNVKVHFGTGSPIWFQIHRGCMLLTFLIMTIAFFGVFWQQNFRIFTCSTICQTDDFNKSMHALVGTIVYVLCCLQVLLGLFRPSHSSPNRRLFNFVHTFNGFAILLGTSANAALSTSIGKTGFLSLYGKFPHTLLIAIFLSLFACFLLCEWLTRSKRFEPDDPDRVQRLKAANDDGNNNDGRGEGGGEQQRGGGRTVATLLLVMAFNTLAGIAALGLLWAMLIQAYRLFSTPT